MCICGNSECLIPHGECHCGCGGKTRFAQRNNTGKHLVKGMPLRYLTGHGHEIGLAVRFWRSVNKFGPVVVPNLGSCWIWMLSKDKDGYGQIGGPVPKEGKRRQLKAHRVSWEIHFGAIHDNLGVLHRCDNPACCNPNHLFLGDDADNSADAVKKGRKARGLKARCGVFTPEQIVEIRREAEYLTHLEIAARYGVTRSAIGAIVSKKNYRYIE